LIVEKLPDIVEIIQAENGSQKDKRKPIQVRLPPQTLQESAPSYAQGMKNWFKIGHQFTGIGQKPDD
jgi:hypothetical protein